MPLNLITDEWIPVFKDGERVLIRPYQIAENNVERLAWFRPDFNLACMELLIGMIFLADPPNDDSDLIERYHNPNADRLKKALEPFESHFELMGNGTRFLQDLENFEVNQTKHKSVDMLFIDSAGEQTEKHNSDLIVHRDRYKSLSLPEAAMALYTLQAFAPAGGSGNRTSMRGGGPLVSLIQPLDCESSHLWRTIWLNVPAGKPLSPDQASEALPWLRKTRTSENNKAVILDQSHKGEMFFGMPRRLRLIEKEGRIVGVVQKNYGTNYSNWIHFLSPYYRNKPEEEFLPVHPKPGKISYQNWLGLIMEHRNNDKKKRVAGTVRRFNNIAFGIRPKGELLLGGWAMSNMTPLDFNIGFYPSWKTEKEEEDRIAKLIEAAEKSVSELIKALKDSFRARKKNNATPSLRGESSLAIRENFYFETEITFKYMVQALVDKSDSDDNVEKNWLDYLRKVALGKFDKLTTPVFSELAISDIEKIIKARTILLSLHSKNKAISEILDLNDSD